MKNDIFKKNIVFLIFILLIFLSFTSIIEGHNGNKFNLKSTYPLINNHSNNDFVQAYWKCDEGSGNILVDSSNNAFDGSINGAAWVTGYSGYALDFNGIDNFVSLDSYSVDLGFNKTDDLNISFYFKSSSTESGIIYCIGGINNIPETRIELLGNGSLSFKAWTNVCGIVVFSNGSYNDGDWHYVEILYNGITANPTIDIYVDNNHDGTVTDWLCDINNNDFTKAKIGRRAYSESDFFNGVIDEFKIIKYPGGNKQDMPDISGPKSGESGVEYEYFFVTNDPELDDIELYIDWDDGTQGWLPDIFKSGEEVIVSHIWNEDGLYEIRTQSRDFWDDGPWNHYPVSIGNHPPNAPGISGPTNGKTGEEYEYEFFLTDIDSDPMYLRIDWGTGSPGPWEGPYNSDEVVKQKYLWEEQGTYTIQAQAKDIFDIEGAWGTLDVSIPKNKVSVNSISFRFFKVFILFERFLSILN
jgi:hypothetical protein